MTNDEDLAELMHAEALRLSTLAQEIEPNGSREAFKAKREIERAANAFQDHASAARRRLAESEALEMSGLGDEAQARERSALANKLERALAGVNDATMREVLIASGLGVADQDLIANVLVTTMGWERQLLRREQLDHFGFVRGDE
jgi:hypothetical protein